MKSKYVIQIYKIVELADVELGIYKIQERYEYFTESKLHEIKDAIKRLRGTEETFNYNKWKKSFLIPWNTPASAESASPALSQGLTANNERGQGNA